MILCKCFSQWQSYFIGLAIRPYFIGLAIKPYFIGLAISRFCTSASVRPVIWLTDCSQVFLTFRLYIVDLPKDGFQYVIMIRAVSSALHTPNWRHAVTGAQNSVPSPLRPPKKASTPQIEIRSTRNQWSWGALWMKSAYTLQLLYGPLWKQSSLLIHYNCCWALLNARYLTHCTCYWGPLWKRSEPTCTFQLLLWSLWKQRTYAMQLLLGALVKQSTCTLQLLLGPRGKQSSLLTHCSCSWGALWRQSTELWCGSENIRWADNKFFTKNEEYLHANSLRGALKRGGQQVPRLPSLKHTTLY